MRVISGEFKGRKLQSSADLSIRPTTDRVKEYIFNILQDFPTGKSVTDIFAGSGNLGIESLSRGAQKVYFVEKSDQSIEILKQNLAEIGIENNRYQIIQNDALTFAKTSDCASDLYFMDPPFKYPPLQQLVNTLTGRQSFKSGHLLVVEHEISNPLQMEFDTYHILKQKKIGRSLISFIEKKE